MEFSDVLNNRRSIRAFSDKAIDQSILDEILLEAAESPSSSNTQPYKLAVATGDTCQQLGQALLEKYYSVNKIQRMPTPKKLFKVLTSKSMPTVITNLSWVNALASSSNAEWKQEKAYMKY